MGIRHKRFPLFGVQFHPESFLTECGSELLQRFLAGRELTSNYRAAGPRGVRCGKIRLTIP